MNFQNINVIYEIPETYIKIMINHAERLKRQSNEGMAKWSREKVPSSVGRAGQNWQGWNEVSCQFLIKITSCCSFCSGTLNNHHSYDYS